MGSYVVGAAVASLASLVLWDQGQDYLWELYAGLAGVFFIGGALMTL